MKDRFKIAELYAAYRKAKFEAYHDTNCAHGLAFSAFESNLDEGLAELHKLLNRTEKTKWPTSREFIGEWTTIPRAFEPPDSPPQHFFESDPFRAWTGLQKLDKPPELQFREVIRPSVPMMVVSALWALTAGERFDAVLSRRHIFGNRLRRFQFGRDNAVRPRRSLNWLSHPLFEHYPSSYGRWQRTGLQLIQRALRDGEEIVALTMDLTQFYHRVDPAFLLDQKFLDTKPRIKLNDREIWLTSQLLRTMSEWRAMIPGKPLLGIPVGLSASPIIANVLLRAFDQATLERLAPLYYGRYVDDVFLVLKPGRSFKDSSAVLDWLVSRYGELLERTEDGVRLKLSNVGKSELEFASRKQKIFQLQGEQGLDLIQPITDSLRERASEHRDMPSLPETEAEMVGTALLAADDATLEADALRKADAVSLRRSGLSMLLSDAEAYSWALAPNEWRRARTRLFGLVFRNLLTPQGFLNYARYIPRLFGLAARCGDWSTIRNLLHRLDRVRNSLKGAKIGGREPKERFKRCWANVAAQLAEAILRVGVPHGSVDAALHLLGRLFGPGVVDRRSATDLLAACDWGDAPHAALWLEGRLAPGAVAEKGPPNTLPNSWRFNVLKTFARTVGLAPPLWKPLMFPTRPPRVSQVSAVCVSKRDQIPILDVVRSLRAVWIKGTPLKWTDALVRVDGPTQSSKDVARVVVTSLATSDSAWRAACLGTPELTQARYDTLNRLLSAVIKDSGRWRTTHRDRTPAIYLALPELSVPRGWLVEMVKRLGRAGISLIAGLEYGFEGGKQQPANDAVVALTSSLAPADAVLIRQRKARPAWEESRLVRQLLGVGVLHGSAHAPLYVHGGFRFSVLICSDFTNIRSRADLQGKVDAVFVPEWNQDTKSFSALVEASALDLHAFVAQVNNRRFGDSRVRGPFSQEWERDVVQLKGGLEDFYAVADLDYGELRRFQTASEPAPVGRFKPFPIGFMIDPQRRRP